MRSITRIVFLLLLLTVPAAAFAQTNLPIDDSIFTWTGSERVSNARYASIRVAEVKLDLLSTDRAVRTRLDFDADRSFDLVLEPFGSGSDASAWQGTIDGDEQAYSFLVEDGGLVAGTIRTPVATYTVRPIGPGLVEVLEVIDDAVLGIEHAPISPPAYWAPPVSTVADTRAAEELDVLVLYTPDARAAIGGEAAAQLFAQARITELNLAFANSEISLRARLVKASVISYEETVNATKDLVRLRKTRDGFLDGAHALRDQYGADVVTLLVCNGGLNPFCNGGSIAYVMNDVDVGFERFAFSVVTVNMAQDNMSMSHEIGHNLGSDHDRANAGSGRAFPYSYGYRVPGEFRTVMAYPCQVQDEPDCPRVLHFSNPDVQFGGLPTGVPVGNSLQADDATGFDAVAEVVTAFRPSTVRLCDGEVVTIEGTDAGEQITGTEGADVIDAKGGDDIIRGLEGDDIICAGTGDDTVYGGDGDDILLGGTGDDRIYGAGGNDVIKGQADDDKLNGGKGADIIEDGRGDDVARGGSGWDRFRPGSGNDRFIGGDSPDWIDFIDATDAITIDLAAGTASGLGIGSDTVSQIERVRGTSYADTIYGDALGNHIRGDADGDIIFGKGGNDTIYGDGGDDEIFGNAGSDTLRGGSGFDTVNGGLGSDVCDAEVALKCE